MAEHSHDSELTPAQRRWLIRYLVTKYLVILPVVGLLASLFPAIALLAWPPYEWASLKLKMRVAIVVASMGGILGLLVGVVGMACAAYRIKRGRGA